MSRVIVKAKGTESYRQEIEAGPHQLVSDVSVEQGGSQSGPDPHELLLSALGACTSMTLQMFAGRRGWKIEDIQVELKEDKVEDPENPSRKITKITRAIKVKGDLSPDQLEALTVAADKCLIHKLLTGPKEVATTLERS